VFGSGNYLGLDVNTSKYNRTLVFSTTDPYFTDGISRTSICTTAPTSLTRTRATTMVTTGAVRFGVPFSETTRCSSVRAGADPSSPAPTSRRPTWLCGPLGYQHDSADLGWSRDDRDSALAPNSAVTSA
jgi:outer membrane protein insertion porin family